MRISDWSSDVCSSDLPIYDISLALFRMSVTERQLRSRKREAGVDLNQLLYHHQILLMAGSQARGGRFLLRFDVLRRYAARRSSESRQRRVAAGGFAVIAQQTGNAENDGRAAWGE